MRLIALFLLSLPALLFAAEGFKTVHPDGTVEFSDEPSKGAEKITLPEAQSYPSGSNATSGRAATREKASESPAIYHRFAITSPAPEQTLNHDGNGFSVTVAVTPTLKGNEGHQIAIYIDGQLVAKGSSTTYRIKTMERGAHVLSATLVDGNGSRVMEAAAITFYVLQQSLLKQKGPSPGGGLPPSQ